MNRRELISVGFACFFILSVLVYNYGISPFLERSDLLAREFDAKTKALKQVVHLSETYNNVLIRNENLKAKYSQREQGFTLFTFLEKISVKAGVAKHIDYMKPSSGIDKWTKNELSLVEMKIKGITLSQLLSYLYLAETSKNIVFIKRLSITRDGKKRDTISAVLQVETVKIW